jgi:hypothetical protein
MNFNQPKVAGSCDADVRAEKLVAPNMASIAVKAWVDSSTHLCHENHHTLYSLFQLK